MFEVGVDVVLLQEVVYWVEYGFGIVVVVCVYFVVVYYGFQVVWQWCEGMEDGVGVGFVQLFFVGFEIGQYLLGEVVVVDGEKDFYVIFLGGWRVGVSLGRFVVCCLCWVKF